MKYGSYCIICGHLPDTSAATGSPIANGYAFSREMGYKLCGAGIWLSCLALLYFYGRYGLLSVFAIVGGCFLGGVLCFLVVSRTTIDLERGEVGWCKGLRPFVVRNSLPLREFNALLLTAKNESNGGRTYFLDLIHSSGKRVMVDNDVSYRRLNGTATSLSAALGLPYMDETGGVNRLFGM